MSCDKDCGKFWCRCVTEHFYQNTPESSYGYRDFKSEFLYKNGINYIKTGQGNNVISFDWHRPLYISLSTFEFRWKGSPVKVQKKQRFRTLESKLRESKYKGMTVEQALKKAPAYMLKFMTESEAVFAPECFYFIGCKKSKEDIKLEKEYKSPKIPFGKYKGKTIAWVANKDFGYLEWLFQKYDDRDDWFYHKMRDFFAKESLTA